MVAGGSFFSLGLDPSPSFPLGSELTFAPRTAVRHLHSLRLMRRDGGWIHTLLEEAENEVSLFELTLESNQIATDELIVLPFLV